MKVIERKVVDPAQVQRILIRGVNWVGDAVMTTPAIAGIRKTFPTAKISLLVKPWVAGVFEGSPHIDEILLYDREGRHAGLAGLLRLAHELRKYRFDVAILLQNAFEAALLTSLARIPHRVGYKTQGRGFLLTTAGGHRLFWGRRECARKNPSLPLIRAPPMALPSVGRRIGMLPLPIA
jgi:heptosyltransferase-2